MEYRDILAVLNVLVDAYTLDEEDD